MKKYLSGIYHSFPVQLVLLHTKKFQVLLIFWLILFSTAAGTFMHSYGADSLFLAPEYLGKVNWLSASIVGVALGIFIMSWNITTFILFSRHFRFLATTSKPFLKYCINNGIIPLVFLLFYLFRSVYFARNKELMAWMDILLLVAGFLAGFILIVLVSFVYFFRADKTILNRLRPLLIDPKRFKEQFDPAVAGLTESRVISVQYYLNSFFQVRKPRDVRHYSRVFIETIFNRHHYSAIISIFIAFLFLILIGFTLDNPLFQLPAAAGFIVFFAILIAVSGAFSYFLQHWSMLFLVVLFIALNFLYRWGVIDPTNKAYGLTYDDVNERRGYTDESLNALASEANISADKQNMLQILNNWKARQQEEKPLLYLVSTSGGGNRSAAFTMNVLQQLDSISCNTLMKKVFLITGASGGMLGASYYRALSADTTGRVRPGDKVYIEDISKNLLNALFTSFVARDLAAPAQKFRIGDQEYIKDRGYAFEQKLNQNTRGLLDVQLSELEAAESAAKIPLMFFNSVITRDGRKMIISTQPVRFMMKPAYPDSSGAAVVADAVDFRSFFEKQNPMNLRLLTALRMNATFPYVLPNVWLPTRPVIDVMDAGLRDNYGPETALRFVHVFRDWINENTSGVVLIQISDRKLGGWDQPYTSDDITELATKPVLLLQYNWFKMQEYSHNELFALTGSIMGNTFHRLNFEYVPVREDAGAALNFHLTRRELQNISEAIGSASNQQSFSAFKQLQQPAQAE